MEREFDNVTSIQKYATTNNLVVVRSEEISSKELNPDRDCRAQNGFIGDGRSLSGKFLEKIGLLPKFKSRWNSDGTWNK